MKFLEELSMNAFPALQTTLFDGWILRFADGYSNRANSINPIYPSSKNVQEKIDICEKIFLDRNLKPTYKITPFVFPENLDELLEKRGYMSIKHTSVQTLSLDNLIEPCINTVRINYDFDDMWFDSYCSFNNMNSKSAEICRKILSNVIQQKFYMSLITDNKITACGMAVLENNYIGLFDITVDEKHRNCGYGMLLIRNILKLGKDFGAKNAYLQVMIDNMPALHLYSKLGFREQYQYFYKVLS